MKCEPSMSHISWLESCDAFYEIMHRLYVTADSCRIIQVLHRLLTLLLHGCEPVQLGTLCYCSLQEDKTGNVRVTRYLGAFVLTLAGLAVFGKYLKSGAFCMVMANPPFWGNAATLVVCGNISLIINMTLIETVTEFSAFVRIQ